MWDLSEVSQSYRKTRGALLLDKEDVDEERRDSSVGIEGERGCTCGSNGSTSNRGAL